MDTNLKKTIVVGLLRHLLTLGAGWLLARGYLDNDSANAIIGLVLGLVGMALSANDKKTLPTPTLPDPPLPDPPRQEPIWPKTPPPPPSKHAHPAPPVAPGINLIPAAVGSGWTLSDRSRKNLKGVHPKLVEVTQLALSMSPLDFVVICGLRTAEEQAVLFADKKSRVRRSRHQDGLAVDLMAIPTDGTGEWSPHHYDVINAAMQAAAARLNVRITWGGTWKDLNDLVHFQLEGF